MPSSRTTVYLREECKNAGITGFRNMSNKDMIEKLGSLGKSINLPEKKVAKRVSAKKKREAESEEEKNNRLIEACREFHKLLKEKEEDACEHKFQINRPQPKRICVYCGEESPEKIYETTIFDLIRCNLYYAEV